MAESQQQFGNVKLKRRLVVLSCLHVVALSVMLCFSSNPAYGWPHPAYVIFRSLIRSQVILMAGLFALDVVVNRRRLLIAWVVVLLLYFINVVNSWLICHSSVQSFQEYGYWLYAWIFVTRAARVTVSFFVAAIGLRLLVKYLGFRCTHSTAGLRPLQFTLKWLFVAPFLVAISCVLVPVLRADPPDDWVVVPCRQWLMESVAICETESLVGLLAVVCYWAALHQTSPIQRSVLAVGVAVICGGGKTYMEHSELWLVIARASAFGLTAFFVCISLLFLRKGNLRFARMKSDA